LGSLDALERSLGRKSKEFSGIVKTGRTHLQDAVPMTLGEEFSGYEYAVKKVRMGIEEANERLLDIPLGGTAVGTGINASEEYSRFAISELNSMTRCGFRISENRFASMQNQTGELMMMDSLKDAAIVISKIAGDLRILGSGPRAGIHELLLPEIQPGSSIMPGKVNPSVCEMMIMVCFQAIGNSRVVEEGAMNGQLELDVFMPVIAFNLITSIEIMSNAVDTFNRLCVKGIRADEESIKKGLESNISLATALSPRIGYAKAAEIARRAYKTGKTVKQVCLDMGILDGEELDKVLDPKNMV
jgi:fumarate hydratase class II